MKIRTKKGIKIKKEYKQKRNIMKDLLHEMIISIHYPKEVYDVYKLLYNNIVLFEDISNDGRINSSINEKKY